MKLLSKNSVVVLLLCSLAAFSQDVEDKEQELISLLSNKTLNQALLEGKKRSVSYEGHTFKINDDGLFYLEDEPGEVHALEIVFNKKNDVKKEFLIIDSSDEKALIKPNPLSTNKASKEQMEDFDDLVSAQRIIGIHHMKSKNPQCYLAYAKERLKGDWLERIHALEREEDPRPLAFSNDEEWNEFKTELKELLSPFKGPDAYVAILGSSSTFISENPKKGKNSLLFEEYPACLKNAENNGDLYTFDTPGQEPSDLDVDLLLPKLSELCEKAQQKEEELGSSLGNDGYRPMYFENTLDKCLLQSDDSALKSLVRAVKGNDNSLFRAAVGDKELGLFIKKWTKKLGRDINFTVIIRPDLRKDSKEPEQKDYSETDYMKRNVLIPID